MNVSSSDILARVYLAMEQKGVRRAEVYAGAGLAENTFSVWAKRKTIPRSDVLLRLADYLGVSMRWLLVGQDENGLNADETELIRCYRSMSGSLKEIAREQIAVLGSRGKTHLV